MSRTPILIRNLPDPSSGADRFATEARSEPPLSEAEKQALRLRRYLLAVATYLLGMPLLVIAWLLDLIALPSVLTIFALFVAVNGTLYWIFRSGLNLRFSDPSLTREQTLLAVAVLMYIVYQVDQGRELALMMCLVIFVFGTFRLNQRQFLSVTLIVLAAYALVLNLLMHWRPETVDVRVLWMSWIVLAAMLPWLSVVSGKISALRQRLRDSNRELVGALDTIRTMATHDELTGLANRVLFGESFEQALARGRRATARLSVLYVDVDRFKVVNDSLGHGAGDVVLREVAQRMKSTVRLSDIVARVGGDEFVVVAETGGGKDPAGALARKLLAAVAQPLRVEAQLLHPSVSIGVAAFPDDGSDAQALLSKADAAMYRSKRFGPGGFQFYSAQMNLRSVEHLELEAALRGAIGRGELRVHYQPKVDINSGTIAGAEALLRWQRPAHGLVSPGTFIPLAEETGLIVPIGRWLLQQVCADVRAWQAQGLSLVPVAVNLSSREFQSESLVQDVLATLREHRLPVGLLEFEVTESMVMEDPARAAAVMSELRSAGIGLALDDFGTGYSSLAYLKRFPLTHLKIDRSFVSGLPHDGGDSAITTTVIALARCLGLHTVAEGVESADQLAALKTQGCDQAQGYFLSRPVPELQIVRMLAPGRMAQGGRRLEGLGPA